MIGEPWFWRDSGLAAKAASTALAPASWAYAAVSRLREQIATSWASPVPIVCVGAATLGGVGKTPFALTLAELLRENVRRPHFLTRGYGGRLAGPVRVDSVKHTHTDVGDEALMLAEAAPTWVSRDRRAGARQAAKAGADVIIMDDGYQNPTIKKDFSILLIDQDNPIGNGRIFPAGPLREALEDACARADAVVHIVPYTRAEANDTDGHKAWLAPDESFQVGDERVFAFCGIANPKRFFHMLVALGADVIDTAAFPDHHAYSDGTLQVLRKNAEKLGAALVTTQKDYVRIDPRLRDDIAYLPVRMKLQANESLLPLLMSAIETRKTA